MRHVFLALCATFLLGGLSACDPTATGQKVQDVGDAAAAAGQATGISYLSLGGTILAGLGALIAGKKANVGHAYATGGWSKAEVEELVAALRGYGFKVEGPVA